MKKTALFLSICMMLTTALIAAPTTLADTVITTCESPVTYDEWKGSGNFFNGGFQGFCYHYTWLTEENKALYLEVGDFTAVANYKDQSFRDWQKNHGINGTGKFSYKVIR